MVGGGHSSPKRKRGVRVGGIHNEYCAGSFPDLTETKRTVLVHLATFQCVHLLTPDRDSSAFGTNWCQQPAAIHHHHPPKGTHDDGAGVRIPWQALLRLEVGLMPVTSQTPQLPPAVGVSPSSGSPQSWTNPFATARILSGWQHACLLGKGGVGERSGIRAG
jgi:hypothetical protein